MVAYNAYLSMMEWRLCQLSRGLPLSPRLGRLGRVLPQHTIFKTILNFLLEVVAGLDVVAVIIMVCTKSISITTRGAIHIELESQMNRNIRVWFGRGL